MDREPLLIDLALQGGGSHGAFTWGVLDRLLEEPWLRIAAISGTSAGAMNAAVLADGWTEGGAEGARAALDRYWQRVSRAAAFSPLQRSPLDRMMGRWTFDTSPLYVAMDLMSRVLSPYDLNPLGLNPLRTHSRREHRFRPARSARRSSCSSPRRMCAPAAGASSAMRRSPPTCCWLRPVCRPCSGRSKSMASRIGTAAMPAIRPSRRSIRESDAHDTILVQINPRERPETPRSAADILNRLNEISFNSPLMKELRMIALLRQVADPGTGEGARWAQMRTHRIATDMLAQFGASSKLNAERDFVTHAAHRGPPGGESNFCMRASPISVRARPPISMSCWRSVEIWLSVRWKTLRWDFFR